MDILENFSLKTVQNLTKSINYDNFVIQKLKFQCEEILKLTESMRDYL